MVLGYTCGGGPVASGLTNAVSVRFNQRPSHQDSSGGLNFLRRMHELQSRQFDFSSDPFGPFVLSSLGGEPRQVHGATTAMTAV